MDHNLPLEAGQTFIFANAVNARHWKVQMPLDLWTKDLFFEIVTGSICLQFELLGCKTFGTFTVYNLHAELIQNYSYSNAYVTSCYSISLSNKHNLLNRMYWLKGI